MRMDYAESSGGISHTSGKISMNYYYHYFKHAMYCSNNINTVHQPFCNSSEWFVETPPVRIDVVANQVRIVSRSDYLCQEVATGHLYEALS